MLRNVKKVLIITFAEINWNYYYQCRNSISTNNEWVWKNSRGNVKNDIYRILRRDIFIQHVFKIFNLKVNVSLFIMKSLAYIKILLCAFTFKRTIVIEKGVFYWNSRTLLK